MNIDRKYNFQRCSFIYPDQELMVLRIYGKLLSNNYNSIMWRDIIDDLCTCLDCWSFIYRMIAFTKVNVKETDSLPIT